MYDRLLATDASWNGRFFTGVLTTGIYCLPGCKARKPKAENVRFFPTCEAARAAGLRACRKCHPDDFARGADPVLEAIESLVAEIRSDPAQFADAGAVVRRSGFGSTRLFELFRQHYQVTPAELLLRARLDAAKQRLAGGRESLTQIAGAAGFESLSVFHRHFRERNGLTPAAYRTLGPAEEFTIQLPAGYPVAYLQRALSRDPQSVTERWDGVRYRAAVDFRGAPALLVLALGPTAIEVTLEGPSPASARGWAAHAATIGLLGLDEDAAGFSRLATRIGLGRLVAGRRQLRLSRLPSVFDGLLWSIIGQQINLPFAAVLKRRLIEKTGRPLGDGFYAPPTPAAVARLEPADLRPLQYSAAKAAYVIGAARLVAEGRLDLDGLAALSATRAERTLLAVHGLGPWSVNYLMMRALGFPDCVPLGDTGVSSGLQSLFQLEDRPDADATRRLMGVFAPYRSLATAHLWQFNRPAP
jgi:AraC family transcriptional regulator of adaptative response / DNA-3-methyladenine glycosylase II